MSAGLDRDTLFVALTRPQMFAGVTYSYFVVNLVIGTDLFLIFRSAWCCLRRASSTSPACSCA